MDLVDETLMLITTQLSAVQLKLVSMGEENPEIDVLQILAGKLTQDVEWFNSLKHNISEGYI